MKRALISSAVAIALGSSINAEAGTAGLTGVWNGTYTFLAASPGGGPIGSTTPPQSWTFDFDNETVDIINSYDFFGSVWSADVVGLSDNGDGTYSSDLFMNDWGFHRTYEMVWDITDSGVVDAYGLRIEDGTSSAPTLVLFNGTISAVPIPSAVWLFGSGLIGLIGVARRKKV